MSTTEDLDRAAFILVRAEVGDLDDPPSPGRTARMVAAALSEERKRVIEGERRASLVRAIKAYLDDVHHWDERFYTEERIDRIMAVVAMVTIGRCASYTTNSAAHAAIEATLRNIGFPAKGIPACPDCERSTTGIRCEKHTTSTGGSDGNAE